MTAAITDPAALAAHRAYFREVDRMLAPLGEDGAELRADLAAHVDDSLACDTAGTQAERMERALARLGRPADYLHAALADQYLETGTRSYNPVTLARGLSHGLRAGAGAALPLIGFALGYVLLAVFAAMAALKPFWGNHVGLLRYPDGRKTFGIATDPGAQDVLGLWTVPLALCLAAACHVLLTRALRRTRRRR